jgi:hypothetical protein
MTLILLRFILWNVLNTWFWFKGIDKPNASQCMDPHVFLWANLDALGHVRKMFEAGTIIVVFASLCLVVGWLLLLCSRDVFNEDDWKVSFFYFIFGDKEGPAIYALFSAYGVGLFGMAFGIVAIEVQLKWNNISGVDGIGTSGQIISLVIRCSTGARVVWIMLMKIFSKMRR